MFKFYQLRQFMNHQMMIESGLSYSITVWGATYQTILSSLIITQKYILKVMLNKNKMYSSCQLFIDTSVLQINQIYIKSVVRSIYQRTKNILISYLITLILEI